MSASVPYGQQPNSAVGSPAAPQSVVIAFFLWIAALVVNVVYALVALLAPPSAADYAQYFQDLGLPPEAGEQAAAQVNATAGVTGVVTLVLYIVFAALFAWFGLKMRAGANWARITNAVLAGLGILGAIGTAAIGAFASLPRAGGAFGTILQVIDLLLLIGFLVYLFQRPSNDYFRAVSGRR